MKTFLISVMIFVLAGCSLIKQTDEQALIQFKASPEQTVVVIYNHGTRNPRKKEQCDADYNRVPDALLELQSDNFVIYYLCSHATEGDGPEQAGNQVYARMFEIEQVLNELNALGVPAQNIFLAGHSKGAWASLMLMNQVDETFNAAILFAPALANRRSIINYPWWRGEVRPRQIKQMLRAKKMDALIFAYEDDEYNRPRDLAFLTEHYPQGVDIVAYRCDYDYTHNTHLHDCRHEQTKTIISDYIEQQKQQGIREIPVSGNS